MPPLSQGNILKKIFSVKRSIRRFLDILYITVFILLLLMIIVAGIYYIYRIVTKRVDEKFIDVPKNHPDDIENEDNGLESID